MTIFLIRMSCRSDGADMAEAMHDGEHFRAVSRNGATMALARRMVAAGAPDGPWQAIGPDGRRFYGRSLHRLAALTIGEGECALRLVRWAARPDTRTRLQGEARGGAREIAGVIAPPASLCLLATLPYG